MTNKETKLSELSDEDLLLALADGTEKALDILFLRHSGRVLQYCLKRGLAAEKADDVLQIVFLQIFRKKHLYSPQHRALAWIYVIARSELKDYRNRESKNHSEWDDLLSQTEVLTPSIEHRNESEVLLQELKPRDREVLELRYLEELEFDEISKRLQESPANIRKIISRSLKFLRTKTPKTR